jgi:putative addiction module killer protein
MEAQPREIRYFLTEDGISPFITWLNALRDRKAQHKIEIRLKRVELGNLGDYKSVGEGVYELRLDFGPGYRIYFVQIGVTIILLLCGGDKSTQDQDIQQAQKYWRNYEDD